MSPNPTVVDRNQFNRQFAALTTNKNLELK